MKESILEKILNETILEARNIHELTNSIFNKQEEHDIKLDLILEKAEKILLASKKTKAHFREKSLT